MRFWRDAVRCSTSPIRPPRRPPAPSGWRSLSRYEPTSDAPCRLPGTTTSARFRPAARVHAPCDAHRNHPNKPGRHTVDPVRSRRLHAQSAFHRIAPPQPCDCRWTRRQGFDPASARRAPVRLSFLRLRVTGGRSTSSLGPPRRVSPTVRAEMRATDECRHSRRLRAPTLSRCDRSARLSPALRCVPRFTARHALRWSSFVGDRLLTASLDVGEHHLSCPRRHGHNDAQRRSDRDRDRIDPGPRERTLAPATRGTFHRPMPFDPGAPLRGPRSRASSSARLRRRAPAPDITFRKPVARFREAPVHPNMVVSGFTG